MEPFDARKRRGKQPEKYLQERGEALLRMKGWFVMRTHGNMYQSGFPDTFCTHYKYSSRWIDWKIKGRSGDVFTPAQHECFPKLCANGSGVWILVDATEEEYNKLFKRPNFWAFLEAFK
jgi:hypothetical protein